MLTRLTRRMLPIILAAATGFAIPWPAAAQTVTDCGDTGALNQLRTLVTTATAGAIIEISAACPVVTLAGAPNEDAGATGDLDIDATITIRGQGAARTAIDGGAVDRVFEILAGGNVTLEDLTIRNGDAAANTVGTQGGGIFVNGTGSATLNRVEVTGSTGSQGGGIFVDTGGSLTMNGVAITGNTSSGDGGGLYALGAGTAVTGTNVTVSGNTSATDGGGILNNSTGTLTLTNATIAGNTAVDPNLGGGFRNFGTMSLKNTAVGNNTAAGGSPDCESATGLTSLGNNLIEDQAGCTFTAGPGDLPALTDPGLGPLAQNGGGTRTHLPQAGSPLINAGGDCPPPAIDQRGQPRPARGIAGGTLVCDIGAVEVINEQTQLQLTLNQTIFRVGQTLQAGVIFQSPGDALVGDAFLGIVVPASVSPGLGCPTGQAIAFVTQISPLAVEFSCTTSSPATFDALLESVAVPVVSAPIAVLNFFTLTFPPGTPPGVYLLFLVVTQPQGFADGVVDPGDILALSVVTFTVVP